MTGHLLNGDTVYTLWHNPNLTPLLHTPAMVIDKIKGGADLMTPGLAGPPFPQYAKQGAIVAMSSLDNPTVPIVVGRCEIDISSLSSARGAKGKAVEIFHWSGDDLWNWSTSGKPGLSPPDELAEWTSPILQDQISEQLEHLEIQKEAVEPGGVALNVPSFKPAAGQIMSNDVVEAVDKESIADSEPELTTDEIDNAFRNALLYGIHHQITTYPDDSKHGLNFPLSQSIVMSDLVLPYLPAHTERRAEQLIIKKTSWKTIKKFLKTLDKDRLLLAKEMKTEIMVLDIDFNDAQLKSFTPYRLPNRDKGGTGVTDNAERPTGSAVASDSDASVGQHLKVLSLFKPRDEVVALASGVATARQSQSSGMITAADLRSIVNTYIETANLSNPTNKRMIRLDERLSQALFTSSTPLDAEIRSRGTIPRDALLERIQSNSAPYHLILHNDETAETVATKPKSGPAPRIGIILETRGGNKTATRLHGFEAFHIAGQPLADELRKTCAGSTSLEPFKGGKGLEVMVQGPQSEAIIKALGRRGVNKNWIDVTDKTKGKKK